jgi:hypothetical protein
MILLGITLSAAGCGQIPEAPAVWQCGYSVKFNKFRCVNIKTNEKINLSRDDARMEAAQCLSADDFKASQDWVSELKRLAEQRCK